jgi:hypothetical protein
MAQPFVHPGRPRRRGNPNWKVRSAQPSYRYRVRNTSSTVGTQQASICRYKFRLVKSWPSLPARRSSTAARPIVRSSARPGSSWRRPEGADLTHPRQDQYQSHLLHPASLRSVQALYERDADRNTTAGDRSPMRRELPVLDKIAMAQPDDELLARRFSGSGATSTCCWYVRMKKVTD